MEVMKDRILIKCIDKDQQKAVHTLIDMIRDMEKDGMQISLIEDCENFNNSDIKSVRVSFVPWSDKNE